MKLAFVALALVAACGEKREPAKWEVTVSYGGGSDAPSRALTRQLVTAIVDDWDSTQATLQLWSRVDAEPWQRIGDPWPAVVGRTGSAWGTGLHADPARPGPRKQEGDGRSPAGMFAIRAAYGYAASAPTGSKLPYTPSDKLECVDDPESAHYTQILDGATSTRDWKSSEQMRLPNELYSWVVDLGHNPSATPRGGSCIFLHVWGGATSTTDGCTAMDETKLADLLRQLDPAAKPVYVLLPKSEYYQLRAAWDLPHQ